MEWGKVGNFGAFFSSVGEIGVACHDVPGRHKLLNGIAALGAQE